MKRLDAASVRALAHPLRVALLERLRHNGPATATALAGALGESSGATSYHLRALARAGFVEEVPERGTRRERWWRSAHEATSWRPGDFDDDAEAQAAELWLSGSQARRAMEWIDAWQAARPRADAAAVAMADQSDYVLDMTPAEAEAMLAEVHTVVAHHRRLALDAAAAAGAAGAPDPASAGASSSGGGGAGGGAGAGDERRALRLLVFALPALDLGPRADGGPGGEDDG